jgi:hypothetical protein
MMGMMTFAPSMSAGGDILLLCGRDDNGGGGDARQEGDLEDADAGTFEREGVIVDENVDVDADADAQGGAEGGTGWDSVEAWLVQSNSVDEPSDAVV